MEVLYEGINIVVKDPVAIHLISQQKKEMQKVITKLQQLKECF
jgi:hypothetical protein